MERPPGSWHTHRLASDDMAGLLRSHYLLRTDPEPALNGRYVVPQQLTDEGFEFRYADLPETLGDVVPDWPDNPDQAVTTMD